MNVQKLHGLAEGCLVGAAIGDALGMPVEMATRKQILDATDGRGVTGFADVPRLTRIDDNVHNATGTTTDDTQLMLAVANSLVRKREFDLVDCLQEHVRALNSGLFGWGKTTQDRVKAFGEWFASGGKKGADPHSRSPVMSLGTGVAMKIAPIGVFFGLRKETCLNPDKEIADATFLLGYATHGDPRASVAGVVIASLVRSFMTEEDPLVRDRLISLLRSHGARIAELENIELVHGMEGSTKPVEEPLMSRVARVLDSVDEMVTSASPKALLKIVGTSSFSVMEIIPLALGILLRHPTDFRAAVCEAVNMGGDTDTLACIVGALVGANVGIDAIPRDLLKGCQSTQTVSQVAHLLILAAERR